MKRGLVVRDAEEIADSEWAARVGALQSELAAAGVDIALIYNDVSRGDDIGYLTNLCIYWNEGVLAVPATGEPAMLTLRVMNTSAIVDGYVVEAPDAPEWLHLDPSQVRLLPGSEEPLPVRLRVSSATLVPAQQLQLMLRIRSMSQAPAPAVRRMMPASSPQPLSPRPLRFRGAIAALRCGWPAARAPRP